MFRDREGVDCEGNTVPCKPGLHTGVWGKEAVESI